MSDSLRKRAVMSGLPPPPRSPSGSSSISLPGTHMKKRDYSQLPWNQYFERKHEVVIDDDKFCVYESGSEGPVCFFLHGGGFSGLSWAVLSKMLTEMLPCRCTAMDCRGHGNTVTTDDAALSADVMASDIGRVIQKLYGDEGPPIVLIGHSMGGAMAVHSVVKDVVPTVAGLVVIDVVEGTALDALASMQSFLRGRPSTFKSLEHAIEYCVRSGQIRNVESARVSVIGQVKKLDGQTSPANGTTVNGVKSASATDLAIAAPAIAGNSLNNHAQHHIGTVKEDEDNETDDDEVEKNSHKEQHKNRDLSKEHKKIDSNRQHKNGDSQKEHHNGEQAESVSSMSLNGISNGHSDNHTSDSLAKNKTTETGGYGWRIDLTKTERYWQGWFQGMSKMFLSCSVPKMLLLAGIDRLDKELTVGQMQGKFQMQVLPKCGHAVHEDSPDKVADVVASFLVRNRLVEPTENFQRVFPAC